VPYAISLNIILCTTAFLVDALIPTHKKDLTQLRLRYTAIRHSGSTENARPDIARLDNPAPDKTMVS